MWLAGIVAAIAPPPKLPMVADGSESDDAEARVVNFMLPVQGDGERRHLFDRAAPRQRPRVHRPKAWQQGDQGRRARPRRVGVATDELVAVQRRIELSEQPRRNRLERARQLDRSRQTRSD